MDENGSLYTSNKYDKIKQIYRNIYLSPLDFGDLYFEIGKRLEIANQIRDDLKSIYEENQAENQRRLNQQRKRIPYSRIETDLNHFRKNCQIPGIIEVDKVTQQIKTSKMTIESCMAILTNSENFPDGSPQTQIASLEKARKI